jgi:hypothetical protein
MVQPGSREQRLFILPGSALRSAIATDDLIARDAVVRQDAFDHVRAMQSRILL